VRILHGGDFILKRGAPVLWVVALLAGWVVGTSSVWAAGAPKVYVGLFKDDAVAVIDIAQNKVIGTISVPKGPHGLVGMIGQPLTGDPAPSGLVSRA